MIQRWWKEVLAALVIGGFLVVGYVWAAETFGTVTYTKVMPLEEELMATTATPTPAVMVEQELPTWPAELNRREYDERLLALAGYEPPQPRVVLSTSTGPAGEVITTYATTTPPSPLRHSSTTNVTVAGAAWPPAQPYPHGGAVLPFQRILAYYGNFYSRYMGILGEYEPEEVLRRLAETQALWEAADPDTPVLPAIEYIAMVAQADAGADGMYRAVMPDAEIEKAYALAQQIDGVMILDIQIGLSSLQAELPKFKKFLERPDVFFALDPEFAMHDGARPGTVIGSFDAADINYTIDYLADIVREKQLPPKVLLVHRFTQDMVTNAALIKSRPEVQVVMVMDGWGPKELKRATYKHIIEPEPVQFTGLKVFYKNDLKPPSTGLLSPTEILQLHPTPIYIQYQ